MKNIFLKFISTILFSILIPFTTFAFTIPNSQGYVTDLSWKISVYQKKSLEAQIISIEKESTVEIWVLIVNTIDWENIEELSFKIWQKWWIWKKDKNNWIFILIAVNDRQFMIATWYWIEWTIPDALARRIWEDNFPKFFREWNYFQWISSAISDIWWLLKWNEEVKSKYWSNNKWVVEDDNLDVILPLLVLLIFILWAFRKKFSTWTKLAISLFAWLLIYVLTMIFVIWVIWTIAFLIVLFWNWSVLKNSSWSKKWWSWWWSWWGFQGWSSWWGFSWGSFWWGGSSGRW